MDAKNHPLRLISVNWFGFDEKEYVVGGLDHQPLNEIVAQIRKMGFNSVRLPWANEVLEKNPAVPDYALKANPQLRGKHSMEIMDAVVGELAKQHILVILDNHVSRADWCCNDTDGNGLWASKEYPEAQWLQDWKAIVNRYAIQPYVVGADLRNELRSGAKWGGDNPALDWHAAAERGGKAVLDANPNLLVIVEGPGYSADLRGFAQFPVRLPVPNRLIYSPHDYGMSHGTITGYEQLKAELDERWGYLTRSQPEVPLWIGEFGICQQVESCTTGSDHKTIAPWFKYFLRYVRENNLSWSYWPLNGTQSSGARRTYDAVESYGLLDPSYGSVASPELMKELRTIGLQPN